MVLSVYFWLMLFSYSNNIFSIPKLINWKGIIDKKQISEAGTEFPAH